MIYLIQSNQIYRVLVSDFMEKMGEKLISFPLIVGITCDQDGIPCSVFGVLHVLQ